jgi:hypothetical protein
MYRGKSMAARVGISTLGVVLTSACLLMGQSRQQPHQSPPPRQAQVPRPPAMNQAPRTNEAPRPSGQTPYSYSRQPTNQTNQGHHAGQWLRQYKDAPPEQQRRALTSDPNFRRLPPQQQQRYMQRLQDFSKRPPEQQQRILNRMETWEHLTPQQKGEARQLHSQLQQLPPERRQAVQNAIQALRGMPPDARQRAIESGRFNNFSPQERDLLNGVSQLPLAPAQPPQTVPRPPQ